MARRPVVPEPHTCRDPKELIGALTAAHEAALDPAAVTAPGDGAARAAICDSWRRSWEAGVGVETETAPLVFDTDVVADARAAHPLDRHLPMLRALLGRAADESAQLMVITDAEGHALWSEGPPPLRRAAAEVGLLEGFCWSESSVGTNGIGTALALGRPEYVYSAEHMVHALRGWSCAGAPVTDPDTGRVIGCIDLSATVDALHPASVALVGTAARLAESRLELDMHRRDEALRERYLRHLRGPGDRAAVLVTATGRVLAATTGDWRGLRFAVPAAGARLVLPDGRPAVAEPLGEVFLLRDPGPARRDGDRPLLTLCLLGAAAPYALLDGRPLALSQRHAEILALLALNPRGLNADRLSAMLYGDEGNPVTIRAEIHRLRAQLGGLLPAKPYRLDCELDADFLLVRRLLAGGRAADLRQAVRLHQGELLPLSESPVLRAERDELAVRLRRQLLDRGDPEALWAYAETPLGQDDLEVLQRLAAILPPGDSRRVVALSRAHRVLAEDF
ncbi:helix-turn-helix domain-containing protein [Thermomonospora umbrina]|uniref:GAF domain-containing protein n=1 Tax=Thermomonospora umbrina TaxID=111806 RepID=A0A3D9SKG0_9ACTN|nr:helix-turn-helix domain-containing protein [Thermomonospora umbrina]REE94870.1 GAF domain-containing protein [Thermomonospora umbrina]